jgi:hypothetical protein
VRVTRVLSHWPPIDDALRNVDENAENPMRGAFLNELATSYRLIRHRAALSFRELRIVVEPTALPLQHSCLQRAQLGTVVLVKPQPSGGAS